MVVYAADGFVPVMVPSAHVADVYALIARLEGKGGVPEPQPDSGAPELEAGSPPDADTRALEWGGELVRRSWAESPRSMTLVLRRLAGAANQWIPSDELARVAFPDTGNRRQLAGALGAWGHRCSSRYGVTTSPFEVRWNHESEMYEYSMEEYFADLYRQHFD